ncbi:hypothetical protein K438DRAFT_1764265 [Mycena galopus ATCC 62051]|nr:hypothetical protein K438DRAFT_1764265 [Mycena galopus ATCC 62051]
MSTDVGIFNPLSTNAEGGFFVATRSRLPCSSRAHQRWVLHAHTPKGKSALVVMRTDNLHRRPADRSTLPSPRRRRACSRGQMHKLPHTTSGTPAHVGHESMRRPTRECGVWRTRAMSEVGFGHCKDENAGQSTQRAHAYGCALTLRLESGYESSSEGSQKPKIYEIFLEEGNVLEAGIAETQEDPATHGKMAHTLPIGMSSQQAGNEREQLRLREELLDVQIAGALKGLSPHARTQMQGGHGTRPRPGNMPACLATTPPPAPLCFDPATRQSDPATKIELMLSDYIQILQDQGVEWL